MKRSLLVGAVLLLMAGVAVAGDAAGGGVHYQLQVDGLVCPFCAYNIEKNVGRLDGVRDVKADLKEGLVNVLVSQGYSLDEDEVRKTITDAGFTLKAIEFQAPAGR